jgi:hypothetical protein
VGWAAGESFTTVARRAQLRKQERVPPSSMCSPSSADGPRAVEEQRTPVAGPPSPRRSLLGHTGGAPIPGHPGGGSSSSYRDLISHNLRRRGASERVHPHARGGNCGWGRSRCAARQGGSNSYLEPWRRTTVWLGSMGSILRCVGGEELWEVETETITGGSPVRTDEKNRQKQCLL